MPPNANEAQFNDYNIVFDEKIMIDIDDLPACRKVLQKILMNTESADVTLVADIDEVSVPANRIVLAAANAYFSTMFSTEMKEKNEEKVSMGDIDGGTLKALVRFCYTSQIQITAENVLKILSAASMYLFDNIKIECEKYLSQQLVSRPDLAIHIYEIADKYSFSELIEKTIQMIGKKFQSLVKSDYFCKLSYPLLKRILCSDEKFFVKEERIFEAAMAWVKFDKENRAEFIPNILESIRLVHIEPAYLSKEVKPVCIKNGCSELLINTLLWNDLSKTERTTLLQEKQTKKRAFTSNLFAFGLSSESGCLNIERYCPSSRKWALIKRLSSNQRYNGHFTTIDEKAYFVRLNACNENICSLDLRASSFSDSPLFHHCSNSTYLSQYGIVAVENKIYIIGGYQHGIYLSEVLCFEPDKKQSFDYPDMLTSRARLGVAVMNNLLYAIGGYNDFSFLNTVERFDPLKNEWAMIPNMNHIRVDPGVGVLNEKIYVMGGENSTGMIDSVEVYCPKTNQWSLIASLSIPRKNLAVAIYEDELFAIGGSTAAGASNMVECYDEHRNEWIQMEPLIQAKSNCGTAIMLEAPE